MMELGPRSVERPADGGVVLVGPLDAETPVLVDAGGAVGSMGAGWCVDWWIGADDRWYHPSREPSVRQRRPGAAPVVETAVRIPSGDAVQTVYAVPHTPSVVGAGRAAGEGGQTTVVEVTNQSPVPVALALAVRPYPVVSVSEPAGEPASDHRSGSSSVPGGTVGIDRLDDRTLLIDGVALRLPRPPSQLGASTDHDLVSRVEGGEELSWSGPVAGPEANAVALYPLPHRTSLRFVLGPVPGPDPAAVPPVESVRRGWDTVLDADGGFEFPEAGLSAAAASARARLLLTPSVRHGAIRRELERPGATMARRLRSRLGSPSPTGSGAGSTEFGAGAGLVLAGLARSGRRSEITSCLHVVAGSFPTAVDDGAGPDLVAGVGLAAATLLAAPTGEGATEETSLVEPADVALVQRLVEPTLQLVTLLERTAAPGLDRARAGLALLVDSLGQHEAAATIRAAITDWSHGRDPATALGLCDLETVMGRAEAAGGVGRWAGAGGGSLLEDDLVAAARFWLGARSLLVHEQPGSPDGVMIDLLPRFPSAWRGGSLDVHRAATIGGRVSFALRWHGARPALLWEVASVAPVTVTCRSLDPTWSTNQARGEALLAGSDRGLVDAPGPGDSFQ